MTERRKSILCLTRSATGQQFLEEAAAQDLDVTLLTVESLKDADWPRAALVEVLTVPDGAAPQDVLKAAYEYARHTIVDRVVALDEIDLEAAALIREEMRLPGMGQSTTRYFNDRLAMRVRARQSGVLVPPFVRILHYSWIQRWMDETPGPWVLKPRTSANATTPRMIERPRDLWLALEEIGDRQFDYFLEKYIPGPVFHVESITWNGKTLFQEAHAYGASPTDNGVFSTQTLYRDGGVARALRVVDQSLIPGLGMVSGVAHSEYVQAQDGEFYFSEAIARVGSWATPAVIEVATGINLWVEWARMEAAQAFGMDYGLPYDIDKGYAGSVYCTTPVADPDLSAYAEQEIVLKLQKGHQVGLVVESDRPDRVEQMLSGYRDRFTHDFLRPGGSAGAV